MAFLYSSFYPLRCFFKREDNQFFISIALRSFAIGMILIFEPIYIYLHLGNSLPFTLIFFAFIHGIYSLLTVLGGKIMAKIGYDWAMLISHFFFLGYYVLLSLINFSFFIVPLAVILKALGMMFFWPSYHTSFTRFSKKGQKGKYVSKKLFACILPSVLGPVVGGLILSEFNYTVLFISVLVFLLVSAVPLFFKKEKNEFYNDGYKEAWQRMFRKENKKYTLGFVFASLEAGVNSYLWPLFMLILGIQYLSMGGITSFAVFLSALLALYAGKVSDSFKRSKLLNIGSFQSSFSLFSSQYLQAFKIFGCCSFSSFCIR
jgi:MFS family permease